MLKRIIKIDNVGALKRAVQDKQDLQKLTLVYADNARGKSTLASIFSATGRGDATAIAERKTFGSADGPTLIFRFEEGGIEFNTVCDGHIWQGHKPSIYVFNQEFVERNVYIGKDVTADQRASLLDLALGDEAVVLQSEFSMQSDISRAKAGEIRQAEAALTPHRGNLPVDKFIAQPQVADVDAQLQILDKQLAEARDVDAIVHASLFRELPKIQTMDLTLFKKILGSTLVDVQTHAEELVQRHLAAHSSSEKWIHEGVTFGNQENCPFCGQSTKDLPIIQAYKTFFSEAYTKFKEQIDVISKFFQVATAEINVLLWMSPLDFNQGLKPQWEKLIEFELPTVDLTAAKASLERVHVALSELVELKKARPLEPIDEKLIDEAFSIFEPVQDAQIEFNASIDIINASITEYKKKLAEQDVATLNNARTKLQLQKLRHQPDIAALVDTLTIARAEHKAADTAKTVAKTELEKLMSTLLGKFQKSINQWLVGFGAQFQIETMDTSYAGGDPRSRYIIRVRGAAVSVGPGDSDLTFHAALSEGDKRTLAFSFFLAKLFADPKCGIATVVLDDVFTSLDHHRRRKTLDIAVKIAHECSQLIVLGHDAYFLRELRKHAANKQVGPSISLCLHRDADDYSRFKDFDIDEYLASGYFKHYTLVENYIAGLVPLEDNLNVAIALRPLVEGHLHRSFPKRFREGQTFGQMLQQVKNATAGNSLIRLQPLVKELADFNDYAGAYHHDTENHVPARTEVSDGELRTMAQGALNFIQSRKLWSHC